MNNESQMQKFSVTGMSCAACSARVEKAVSKLNGIEECSVSLLTNSMQVKGTASTEKIIKAVEKAGYGANPVSSSNSANSVDGDNVSSTNNSSPLDNSSETKTLVKRLIFSSVFLIVLMYFSMAHAMWHAPLPKFFEQNYIAIALVQMILAAIIMTINKKFFVNGFRSLFHLSPNMDTLVALGSGISFLYSTVVLFKMTFLVSGGQVSTNGQVDTNIEELKMCLHNLYFESSAMIVTLITIGKLLESVSKGKTTDALKNLMKLAPKTALVLQNGEEVSVPIEKVKVDDIFIVKPGMNIPVDGLVLEGNSSVDESSLTGESLPIDKKDGDTVFSGTLNADGFLKCRATKVGSDTTISKIIQLVSESSGTKAPIARIADRVSLFFVPTIMGISLITFIIWILVGSEFSFALSRAIAVLVVSCPCALGLATPVAIMVGNGVGARNGILFKTSTSLEQAGKIQTVILDKTGTITKGKLEVTDIVNFDETNFSETELLKLAASLEAKSEHPIAKAICHKVENYFETSDFVSHSGSGIEAKIEGKRFFVGKIDFVSSFCKEDTTEIRTKIDLFSQQGKTCIVLANENKILCLFALADTIKEESSKAIADLKKMGLKVVMLTGDNEKTAKAIANKVGVDQVIANVLPEQKADEVEKFKKLGKTAMVGDGVNDAIALTKSDIGIAIGAGSDVALDCADIVLVKSKLDDVAVAVNLSQKTILNIKENLFWAFFYNVALIPVAAGAYYVAFGLQMSPMLGAFAMSLSSFCVVMNALRLNLAKVRNIKSKLKQKNKIQKEISMKEQIEKTLKVEGLMCSHCDARVKEAVEKIRGVESALANHENGTVKVVLSKDVKEKDFSKAVTDAGYKFLGIE